MRKIKKMFMSKQSRYGTYSTLLIVAAIVVAILLNMVAGKFPETWKNIDLSSNNLYEITEQSVDLLNSLDKKVDFIVMADQSSVDERIQIFISKYAGLSDKISVEWVDPVAHPSILEKYEASTDSIVVYCEETGKQQHVDFSDIIVYDEYYYYYYGSYYETEFDGEGQLTSAVNYVVNETSQQIYRTSGHGETSFSSSLSELMSKSNFVVSEINTMMTSEIPEDCDLMIMNGPTADITEDEKKMISDYMQAGGDFILLLADNDTHMPNLEALLAEYGMMLAEGYIADTSRNYQGNAYYIFPELSVSGDLAAGISTEMILLINSRGVEVTEPERDTVSVSTFMETSNNGYAVTEESQIQGTYTIGAIATDGDSNFTVVTSYSLIDSYITDSGASFENLTLFMNLVTNNFEEVNNIAIEAKSLEATYNTVQYVGLGSLIVIFGVPILILLFGFVNWLKRRKA